uniref:ARAD1D15488p n=1 Tax=Blastobotrys adeninivorans TaxID=409370 RepID=A0A060T9Z3_BLAAD
MSTHFLESTGEDAVPRDPLEYLKKHLEGNKAAVATTLASRLRKNPGDDGFVLSYVLSSWFPIIAASLGPISNLNSVGALVDRWRMPIDGSERPGDLHWVLGLNALSLFFGCAANISLFLNYAGKLNYSIAQYISILGWYCASGLLMSLLIATRWVYFGDGSPYVRSQGYWHAVITCILYGTSATMLFVNEIGHLQGRYGASFNLTTHQRSLMVQNVVLLVWIAAGGAVFAKLNHITYADGVYYCVVTVLTIGLGDILPPDTLARALCLPFAFIGVIMLGLIVATIRSVVLEAGSEMLLFHRNEKMRNSVWEQLNMNYAPETFRPSIAGGRGSSSFGTMRRIWDKSRSQARLRSVLSTLTAFLIFLLLGAMVFYFSEPWSYFEAVYFCCLCLLTIGYGDFAPTSNASRPFFVVWSLGAVPLMTILISNLGDTLFSVILEGNNMLGDLFLGSPTKPPADASLSQSRPSLASRGECDIIADAVEEEWTNRPVGIDRAINLCHEIRTALDCLISSPSSNYEFAEWAHMLHDTLPPDMVQSVREHPHFWVSDKSPLRYPIVEPQLFLERYLLALEFELQQLKNPTKTGQISIHG